MSQELLAAIEADDTARAAAALDEHGATLIDVLTASGNTALHAAAFAGRAQLCKLFLVDAAVHPPEYAVQLVNLPRKDTATPLILAAQNGHADCVKLLLGAGADVHKANDNGATPLFMATQKAQLDCVRLLLEARADVDTAHQTGATPLFVAAQEGEFTLVRLLLEAGADQSIHANGAPAPLLAARHMGHSEIATLLEAFAATPREPGEPAATHARRCGLADQPLPPGTWLRVGQLGKGAYERFERCAFGANDHYIHFTTTGLKKVELKKLPPEQWAVIAEEHASMDEPEADESDSQAAVAHQLQFSELTGVDVATTKLYLQQAGGDLMQAVNAFFAEPEPELEPEPEPEPEPELGPGTEQQELAGSLVEFLGPWFPQLQEHLEQLGAEDVEDLTELEAEHIDALASKLKELQAKRFRKKLAALCEAAGAAAGAAAACSPTHVMHEPEPEPEPVAVGGSRMAGDVEVSLAMLPMTKWTDVPPSRSCIEELLGNARIRATVPDIDSIAEDVRMKVLELQYTPTPIKLDPDSIGAIVAYTHDLQQVGKQGNLYFELNGMLRQRVATARATLVQTWGGYMYFMMTALSKLPDFEGECYRGYNHGTQEQIVREYAVGRPIQWGAFTSVTTSLAAARGFAPNSRVIFKITVTSGRDINAYSFFPQEGEILLSPSHRFTVSSKPREEGGFTVIDLVQVAGTAFVS
jgi:hypothetical protein